MKKLTLVRLLRFIALLLLAIISSSANAQVTIKLPIPVHKNHTYQIIFNTGLNRYWQNLNAVTPTTNGTMILSLPTNVGSQGFYSYVDMSGPQLWDGYKWYPQSSTLQTWGMGTNLLCSINNDKPCDYYIDQMTTGYANQNNCGPTTATMTCKWRNPATTATAQDARATYPMGGGWWYTTNVVDYLNLMGINNDYYPADVGSITNLLAQGDVLILCVNMTDIVQATNSEIRVHKFYTGVTGHFLMVIGYHVTDSGLWLDCYDPYDDGAIYADGTPKGRDRHYSWTEMSNAINSWWPFCIAVPPAASGSAQSQMAMENMAQSMATPAISPSSVPVAQGQ